MTRQAPERRGLAAYLATATLARMTSEATGPALLLVTIAILGSASTGSYLVAALTASAAVAGPVIGVAFDRTRWPVRAFAISMITVGVGVAMLAFAVGRIPVPLLVVLAVVAGIGMPALTGAWTAQLPGIVPSHQLSRAYGADAGTYSVAAVLGPPIASALIVVSSVAPLWMPVATIVVAITALRWVPLRPRHELGGVEHEPQESRGAALLADLRRGFGAMLTMPRLRRVIVTTTIINAGLASLIVAAPIIAQERTGELGYTGIILGTLAAGDVIAAAIVVRWPIKHPDRTIMVTILISAIALAGVGLAPNMVVVLGGVFVMGTMEAPLITAMFYVRNSEAPPSVVTQVFTTGSSLRMTATAIGTAISGLVLHAGVGWVIAFGVAVHLLAIALGLLAGPAVIRRESTTLVP